MQDTVVQRKTPDTYGGALKLLLSVDHRICEAMTRLLYCLALVLQILTWVPATSRLFCPENGLSSDQLGTGSSPKSSYAPYTSIQGKSEEASKEARYTGVKKVGSRPPDCEHKCEGCIPCEAIQVPTITSHFSLQYGNYEPESWKCKCGLSFYSP